MLTQPVAIAYCQIPYKNVETTCLEVMYTYQDKANFIVPVVSMLASWDQWGSTMDLLNLSSGFWEYFSLTGGAW